MEKLFINEKGKNLEKAVSMEEITVAEWKRILEKPIRNDRPSFLEFVRQVFKNSGNVIVDVLGVAVAVIALIVVLIMDIPHVPTRGLAEFYVVFLIMIWLLYAIRSVVRLFFDTSMRMRRFRRFVIGSPCGAFHSENEAMKMFLAVEAKIAKAKDAELNEAAARKKNMSEVSASAEWAKKCLEIKKGVQ